MTVAEVIDMAKFGELRNLHLGDSEDRAIVSYINLGLIELYKRFPLSVKEHIIELTDTTANEYTLPNDCMWLITAYGEVPETSTSQYTQELSINNENDPLGINTISWNKVQIPLSMVGAYVSLIYAAAPDQNQKVTYDEAGLYLLDDLQLPAQLIEPLLFYIGYRAHGAMDGNIQSESNTHYMRFDASCNKIKTEGMFTNDDMSMAYRVQEKGYV
jgi:hypothetical protein